MKREMRVRNQRFDSTRKISFKQAHENNSEMLERLYKNKLLYFPIKGSITVLISKSYF